MNAGPKEFFIIFYEDLDETEEINCVPNPAKRNIMQISLPKKE